MYSEREAEPKSGRIYQDTVGKSARAFFKVQRLTQGHKYGGRMTRGDVRERRLSFIPYLLILLSFFSLSLLPLLNRHHLESVSCVRDAQIRS